MTTFEVYVTATYQAQEEHIVMIEATDKDEAEAKAQKLADDGKFIGEHIYLKRGEDGFQIFMQYGDISYEAQALENEVETQ